jgi:hypothetical protein
MAGLIPEVQYYADVTVAPEPRRFSAEEANRPATAISTSSRTPDRRPATSGTPG